MASHKPNYFIQQSKLPASAERVWKLMTEPCFYTRLAPPWINLQGIEPMDAIQVGHMATIRVQNGALKGKWQIEVSELKKGFLIGYRFSNEKNESCTLWSRCLPGDHANECILENRFEYPKRSGLGRKHKKIESLLKNITFYKHRTLKNDLTHLASQSSALGGRVLIAGGSGLIGSHLRRFLRLYGYEVDVLTTQEDGEGIRWDPENGMISEPIDGYRSIINLAGSSIACRWSEKQRNRILSSRVSSTQTLVEALNSCKTPPESFIQTSATGYYGYEGSEPRDESSPKGYGFLADVCEQWEKAALSLEETGIRLVRVRIGVVQTPRGGALSQMLPIFRLGLGGPLGSGQQGMPWISIDDLLRLFHFLMRSPDASGVFNACSPAQTDNRGFTKGLAGALGKPALFPVPPFALKLRFGSMAKEALLGGVFAKPTRVEEEGFHFQDHSIEDSLRYLLGKW